jgi:hypothetical protein
MLTIGLLKILKNQKYVYLIGQDKHLTYMDDENNLWPKKQKRVKMDFGSIWMLKIGLNLLFKTLVIVYFHK